MGTVYWIKTDGSQQVSEVEKMPTLNEMRAFIAEGLEDQNPIIERVRVLFREDACSMFVHETGAVMTPPLPINAVATILYRNNAIAQHMTNIFMIHGRAVLLDGFEDVV